MIKDNTVIMCDFVTLHFSVSKGGNVRQALRGVARVLETQKDKSKAVLKSKEFEMSFYVLFNL